MSGKGNIQRYLVVDELLEEAVVDGLELIQLRHAQIRHFKT